MPKPKFNTLCLIVGWPMLITSWIFHIVLLNYIAIAVFAAGLTYLIVKLVCEERSRKADDDRRRQEYLNMLR